MAGKKDKDKAEADVLGKLDKVADTLESATSQLSGAVTQQQLDLVKDRVTLCESDLNMVKEGYEVLVKRSAAHATEADSAAYCLNRSYESLERDFAGLRALVLSAFALSTISLMGLIIFVVVF